MKKIGIVADPVFLSHCIEKSSFAHPIETPERLMPLYARFIRDLDENPLYSLYQPANESLDNIKQVHSDFYLRQLQSAKSKKNPFWYCSETYITPNTLKIAVLASNAVVQLASAIHNGEIDSAYAIIRPPGHHADRSQAMGYCILNNVAIAATHLLENCGISKILILDFDAHHGNGTQRIFYDSNKVLFVSIHESNLFPKRSGQICETGIENGLGYTVNLPVYSSFGDLEYMYILSKIVEPIVTQYQPEFIIVSAGYDGHERDSISNLQLTTDWFDYASRVLKNWASRFSDNRLLFVLEGGYNPDVLDAAITGTLRILAESGVPTFQEYPLSPRAINWANREVYPTLSKLWSISG